MKGGFHMSKSQKEIPLAPEETKYKKKSNAKGLSRSKHKHEYKTVLLHHEYSLTKPHDPNPWRVCKDEATQVCTICGRIGDCDNTFYEKTEGGKVGKFSFLKTELIKEAYDLEKWETTECGEKYARKCEN